MPNIVITTNCNLQCPYCFAREFTEKPKKLMSESDYRFVLGFLKRNDMRVVRLIGGEPTLHPQFCRFVQIALRQGMDIQLITNGLWDASSSTFLSTIDPRRIEYLINVNHPSTYSSAMWKRIHKTLTMVRGNPAVTLSINIDSTNCDYGYIFDLCDRYEIRRLRYVVVRPSLEGKLAIPDGADFMGIVVDFLNKAQRRKIRCASDCSFVTPCAVMKEKRKQFFLSMVQYDCRETPIGVCTPALDVLPDLRVIHCFGVGTLLSLDLKKHASVDEICGIYNYFHTKLLESDERCARCGFALNARCSGGCVSTRLRSDSRASLKYFRRVAEKETLPDYSYRLTEGTVLKLQHSGGGDICNSFEGIRISLDPAEMGWVACILQQGRINENSLRSKKMRTLSRRRRRDLILMLILNRLIDFMD